MANPTPPRSGGQELPDNEQDRPGKNREYHDPARGNGGQQDLQSDDDDEFDDEEDEDEDEDDDETEEETT